MKFTITLLATMVLNATVFAFNPITDLQNNWQWTIGKQAEVGTAVKLCGDGDVETGGTTRSLLAGIGEYRMFTIDYGATQINRSDATTSDTLKIGLKLTSFFGWFKNPITPEMSFMKNMNIGPSVAMPLLAKNHPIAVFLDVNYAFGAPTPTVPQ